MSSHLHTNGVLGVARMYDLDGHRPEQAMDGTAWKVVQRWCIGAIFY